MTISQEEKIERRHASLQIVINAWMEAQFPAAYAKLDQQTTEGGIKMPSGYYMTVDTISLHMASAALEVLKLAFDNAGLDAQ